MGFGHVCQDTSRRSFDSSPDQKGNRVCGLGGEVVCSHIIGHNAVCIQIEKSTRELRHLSIWLVAVENGLLLARDVSSAPISGNLTECHDCAAAGDRGSARLLDVIANRGNESNAHRLGEDVY